MPRGRKKKEVEEVAKPVKKAKQFSTQNYLIVQALWDKTPRKRRVVPYAVTGGKTWSEDITEEVLTPKTYHFKQSEADILAIVGNFDEL